MQIKGAHVLVTGAGRGIGLTLATRFAEAGADVTLVARSADELARAAEKIGGRAHPTDLTDRVRMANFVADIESVSRPIDILVNNAADECVGRFDQMTADTLRFIIDLNVWAGAELTRQVLPRMIQRRSGHIVSVSSYAGVVIPPSLATYAATKAFVTHHTANLRAELRGSGIGFTTVELGEVADTGLMTKGRTDPELSALFDTLYKIRLSRLITPDEIADHTLRAVEKNRPHVRLPRRLAGAAALPDFARAATAAIARRTRASS
ncbi:SDR family NAD(P)-dependent oxidoreductase [Nocardia sp. NPDC059246]|uniref:SDR family NAD(P)-dependent oxidoreductase n=1 Tax=unclassified Nocardia TaxID=2637762 RepID=UPI0036C9693F